MSELARSAMSGKRFRVLAVASLVTLVGYMSTAATAAESFARPISIHDQVTVGDVSYEQDLSYETRKARYVLRGTDPRGFPDFCVRVRLELRTRTGWDAVKRRGVCQEGDVPQRFRVLLRLTLNRDQAARFHDGTARLRGGSNLGVAVTLLR